MPHHPGRQHGGTPGTTVSSSTLIGTQYRICPLLLLLVFALYSFCFSFLRSRNHPIELTQLKRIGFFFFFEKEDEITTRRPVAGPAKRGSS